VPSADHGDCSFLYCYRDGRFSDRIGESTRGTGRRTHCQYSDRFGIACNEDDYTGTHSLSWLFRTVYEYPETSCDSFDNSHDIHKCCGGPTDTYDL
jgi:hypothetical protein